jgi:hypothetical protein
VEVSGKQIEQKRQGYNSKKGANWEVERERNKREDRMADKKD